MLTRRVRARRVGACSPAGVRAYSAGPRSPCGVRARRVDPCTERGPRSLAGYALTGWVLLTGPVRDHLAGIAPPARPALTRRVRARRVRAHRAGPCTGRGPRSPCGGHTHRPGPRSPGGSAHRAGWPGTCSPGGCCSPARSAITRRVRVPPARPALAWRVRAHRPVTRSPGGPPGPPAGVHLVRGSRATRATRAGPGPGHRPGPGRCRPGGPGPTRCRPAPWAAPDTPAAPPPAAPAPGRAAAR